MNSQFVYSISTRDSMLPPIWSSPEWLISPDCHQKWDWGQPSCPTPFAHAYSHAWASFNFELWEGQSVNELFAEVQEAGPLAGVVRGQRLLPKKILHLVGNFITHFRQKLINTHTKLVRKNMVRHSKPLLKMKEQKNWWSPFQFIKKVMAPPFQLIKKVMTHPHILLPPPPGRNNERSLMVTCFMRKPWTVLENTLIVF